MIRAGRLPQRVLETTLRWDGRLLGGVAAFLAVTSYFAYTTAGVDFEVETPTGCAVVYYRLRWDDGATWAGRAVQPVSRPDRSLDWFDPGGTLLAAPSRPAHAHWWNRWGFWAITWARDDPYVALRYPGATASCWVAVPSWLVILAGSVPWGRRWLIRRRLRTPRLP